MSDLPEGTDSGKPHSSYSEEWWMELGNVTRGSSEPVGEFSMRGKMNTVRGAAKIVAHIQNAKVAEQLERLLLTIQGMIQVAKDRCPELGEIPPLHAHIDEDGSALVEWVFPEFRVGFNLEPNPADSGWHLVSNKRLQDLTASGQLANMEAIVPMLVDFILPNV